MTREQLCTAAGECSISAFESHHFRLTVREARRDRDMEVLAREEAASRNRAYFHLGCL
jgi:hypothetical protein